MKGIQLLLLLPVSMLSMICTYHLPQFLGIVGVKSVATIDFSCIGQTSHIVTLDKYHVTMPKTRPQTGVALYQDLALYFLVLAFDVDNF